MSSRKELAGVRIDICSLREALHKIEHYLASEGLHAVETVSMKTVVTAGEDEQVRQCLEDMVGGSNPPSSSSEKPWFSRLFSFSPKSESRSEKPFSYYLATGVGFFCAHASFESRFSIASAALRSLSCKAWV